MPKRRLFALSDPHLSFARPKPMDVFGPHWLDHAAKLGERWRSLVEPGDVVLVPGDISWAMRLEEAKADLEWLAALPGDKILLRGNHDYWWGSLAKLQKLNLPGMHYIQNNHVRIAGLAAGGSRLWDFPDIFWPFIPNAETLPLAGIEPAEAKIQSESDVEKIRIRELERLAASLGGLPADTTLRIALTHFPPLGESGDPTPLTDLIGRFGIDICVFGHVHGLRDSAHPRPGEDIVIGKTRYVLTSSDFLDHTPKLLGEF